MSTSLDFRPPEVAQISEPMNLDFAYDLLKKEFQLLEREVRLGLQIDNPMINQIGNFIWNSGGKRIRPILVFLSSRLCNYFGPKDVSIATAMELVHVASLLHDDVIDAADVRRGNLSANANWGNHLPILVGDYLYTWGSRIIMDTGFPAILRASANTIMDMVDGETSETIKKGDISLSEEEYIRIVQKKTASLFSLCTQSGAILANKDKESAEKLTAYGMNIGISFQLIDDILDYTADEEKLGKPVGIDLKDRKMTLPMIHAIRNSTEEEKKEVKKIFSNSILGSGDLDCCINLIQKYDSYNYTFKIAREYGERAKECLKAFDPSAFSEALCRIPDYIISRNS